MILLISLIENCNSEILISVKKLGLIGIVLLFLIGLHCSAKQVLNTVYFVKTSVTSWLFTNKGGPIGIFLSLTKGLLFRHTTLS